MSHQQLQVQPTRFINAEPGILPFANGPMPIVLLSFGAEEGPIEDRAIGITEARQMVVDILESLATMGDPLAQAIGDQFFAHQENEAPEFDEVHEGDDEDFDDDLRLELEARKGMIEAQDRAEGKCLDDEDEFDEGFDDEGCSDCG